MALPVAGVDAGDGHAGALVAGVDELTAADVDAVVTQARHVRIGEKDGVTGLQGADRDVRSAVVLLPHAATHRCAAVVVDVVHEPGAIEARGRGPTKDVTIAQVLHRVRDDGAAATTDSDLRRRRRGRPGLPGRGRAG